MDTAKVTEQMVNWLREKVAEAGAKGVILGISGGVDSAVVGMIAKRAFPDDTLGVMMPCGSLEEDLEHAMLLVQACGMKSCVVDLTAAFNTMLQGMAWQTEAGTPAEKAARSNIKPRLRMTVLYYLGQANGYLVLGTGNKSELTVGYFTKYGDGGCDLMPLANFAKHEVYELAEYLGVPEVIRKKAPSAGLWQGQTDEGEMGFTYQSLDEYVETGATASPALEKIQRMERASAHKRALPPKFSVNL